MDIEKLIAEITDEIYNKVSSDTSFLSAGKTGGKSLAKYIDHTLLKANATEAQVIKLCQEARDNQFMSVCVNTCYVPLCAKMLANSGVKVCCVVGFPLGAMSTAGKVAEAVDAIKNGATEVDMVINVGAIKSGNWHFVKDDIEALAMACRGKALLKVIIETCLLTDEEKVKACTVSKLAGADFVKTSTGFSTGGATVEDIRLMRQTVGPDMGVKASGGVRTYEDAIAMIEAGASRIGTSNGISIVAGQKNSADTAGHVCIGCGNCGKAMSCPSGKVDIVVANNY
ncbi:MAG: deoxyribose-phosphate aldolase [Eubacterium sp.]|nr:deoxyribose-phosphate aldolase [Eubacterium sp.]